jgi:hypothetical protein
MDVEGFRWIRDLLCRFSLSDTTDVISSSLDGDEGSRHLAEVDGLTLEGYFPTCPFIVSKYAVYRLLIEAMGEIHDGEILSIKSEHLLFFFSECRLLIGEGIIVAEVLFGLGRYEAQNLEWCRIDGSPSSSIFPSGDGELHAIEDSS